MLNIKQQFWNLLDKLVLIQRGIEPEFMILKLTFFELGQDLRNAIRAIFRYDLMVNGGGSVVLTFQRPSFLAASTDVFVPWNEFVVAPSVTMKTPREPSEVPQGLDGGNSCDVSLLFPPSASVLVTTVRAYTAAECEEKGSIVPEMQVLQSKFKNYVVRDSFLLPSASTELNNEVAHLGNRYVSAEVACVIMGCHATLFCGAKNHFLGFSNSN